MSESKTCGPLYRESLEEFTGMDPELIPVFAAGFVSGQAEKIYLGACSAAMFRPASDWLGMVYGLATRLAERYGLFAKLIETGRGPEVWLCDTEGTAEVVRGLQSIEENSPRWHQVRGRLCGIPTSDIDAEFHTRAGHDDPCDV